eukprot:15974_1
MGSQGRIVLELPNLFPSPSLDVDVVIAPSHYAARHWSVTNYFKRIVVVPPGVETSNFTSNLEHRSICPTDNGSSSSCRIVAFIGRFEPEKSPGLFLMACHLIFTSLQTSLDDIPPIRFLMVGDGSLKGALQDLSRKLGLEEYVSFPGFLEAGEVAAILKDVHIIVNPSLRAWSETFCIVNIEAMAAGIPVVSFGVGGVMEYLEDGVNGLLVNEATPYAIAEKVKDLLINETLRSQLGENAARVITDRFSGIQMARRYLSIYDMLITEKELRVTYDDLLVDKANSWGA